MFGAGGIAPAEAQAKALEWMAAVVVLRKEFIKYGQQAAGSEQSDNDCMLVSLTELCSKMKRTKEEQPNNLTDEYKAFAQVVDTVEARVRNDCKFFVEQAVLAAKARVKPFLDIAGTSINADMTLWNGDLPSDMRHDEYIRRATEHLLTLQGEEFAARLALLRQLVAQARSLSSRFVIKTSDAEPGSLEHTISMGEAIMREAILVTAYNTHLETDAKQLRRIFLQERKDRCAPCLPPPHTYALAYLISTHVAIGRSCGHYLSRASRTVVVFAFRCTG